MTERVDLDQAKEDLWLIRNLSSGFADEPLARLEAFIAELTELRAQAGGWKPLWNGELLGVDEGTSYLFAVELTDHWEYFQDAIVWDAETDPDWSDAGHGWSLDQVTHYRELPKPPEATDG
jgi:hypothetical protein